MSNQQDQKKPLNTQEKKAQNEAKAKNLKENEFEKASNIDQTYDYLRKDNDERFGEIALVQNKDNSNLLMLKEKVSNSDKEAAVEIVQAKERLQLQNPFIQRLVDYSTKIKSDFCSKFYKVRLFYEYPDSDLKKQISTRTKNLTYFNHEELTHVAYQSLHGLNYLRKQGLNHGDLRPEFISFSNKGDEHKLLDRLKDPSDTLTANRNHNMAGKALYCSPQVYEAIKKKIPNPQFDGDKNDCWSLGLSILEAATLENVTDIYNKDGTINQVRLQQHLDSMRQRYGTENELLYELTESLLSIDEKERLTSTDYINQLQPYDAVVQHFAKSKNDPNGQANQGQYPQQGGNQPQGTDQTIQQRQPAARNKSAAPTQDYDQQYDQQYEAPLNSAPKNISSGNEYAHAEPNHTAYDKNGNPIELYEDDEGNQM